MTALLLLEDLVVRYPAQGEGRALVQAVDGVSLEVRAGEVVGVVGESGCGKSSLARAAVRLVAPAAGRVVFEGQDLTRLSPARLRPLRRRFQMTFQDPGGALDPRMSVESAVAEALDIHRLPRRGPQGSDRVADLLGQVGLGPEVLPRFPHEISGGQRQRVGLARALAVEPVLLVLDEPLSGLDVSVQAQVLNLLADLQERLGLAYLFISHDLRVVAHLADRVAVMYLGRVVESGPARAVFEDARHPYTRALLAAAMLGPCEGRSPAGALQGEPPSVTRPPPGCRFHPRCPSATERCRREVPNSRTVKEGHEATCFLVEG